MKNVPNHKEFDTNDEEDKKSKFAEQERKIDELV